MPHFRKPLAIAIALAVAAGVTGTALARTSGHASAGKADSRAKLMAAAPRRHAQAALPGLVRLLGSADRLHARGLAAQAGHAGRADQLQEGPGHRGLRRSSRTSRRRSRSRPTAARPGSSRSARASSSPTASRGQAERLRLHLRAQLQGARPDGVGFYGGIVGADGVPEERRRPARSRAAWSPTTRPRPSRSTSPSPTPSSSRSSRSRSPASCRTARRTRTSGTKPMPGTGPYMIKAYDPNQQHRVRAQPVLQGVVAGRPARRLSRQDHSALRPHRRGQVTRSRTARPTGSLRRPAADRLDELGDKYQEQLHINPLTAELLHADEHPPRAVQQPRGAPGRQLRHRPQRRGAAVRRHRPRHAELPDPARRLPGPRALLPVHEEPGRDVDGARPGEGAAARRRSRARPGRRSAIVVQDEPSKGDRHLLAERAEQARLQGDASRCSPRRSSTPTSRTPTNKVQISLSQWYQDYPAASDFLTSLVGCDRSARAATLEHQHRRLLRQGDPGARWTGARALGATDPDGGQQAVGGGRQGRSPTRRRWRRCSTPKHIDFVSKRLGNFSSARSTTS